MGYTYTFVIVITWDPTFTLIPTHIRICYKLEVKFCSNMGKVYTYFSHIIPELL